MRDVDYEVTRTHQMVWPKLLRKEIRGVETLRIESLDRVALSDVNGQCLRWNGLRELILHFSNAFNMFPGPWHPDQSSPIFDLRIALPNLTLLDITSHTPIITDIFFAHLPPNLQTLVLGGRHKVFLASFAKLPASLTKLHLDSRVTIDHDISEAEQANMDVSLPPNLTYLHLDEVEELLAKPLFSGGLPLLSHLEHISARPYGYVSNDVIAKLPLKTLRTRFKFEESESASWPLFLPRSLTSVDMVLLYSRYPNASPFHALLALPRTLLKLEVTVFRFDPRLTPALPPSLESLIVDSYSPFQFEEDFVQLPTGLRYLNASTMALKPRQKLTCDSLTSLRINSLDMPHCLPSSLTSIHVSKVRMCDNAEENVIGEETMNDFLQLRQLRSFKVREAMAWPMFEKSDVKSFPFPDSLRQLHTTTLKVMRGQAGFDAMQLPPHLEQLTVHQELIDENTMKEVVRPMETLKRLICRTAANDANALLWLPTRLVSLSYKTGSVTDVHIAALPRSLELLEIYSESEMQVKVTRPDLAQLFPPMLWKLWIPKTNLFPSELDVTLDEAKRYAFMLPKTLRRFCIGWHPCTPTWWTSIME